ncbi:MAG: magnesium transporter CorA family protein [Nitrospiraceae bacterium]|nr:magnesium transporter CorA family protein [Nitrospiraceae bacterium]
MLTIFRPSDKGIESCSDVKEGTWINLVAPTPQELERIQKELGVLPEFLQYPLDEEETSRIEHEGHFLITIKIPEPHYSDNKVRCETIPLGIIVTNRAVITICLRETRIFEGLMESKNAKRLLEDRVRFVFSLFLKIASTYLKNLRLIDRLITEYEAELHRSVRNRELIKLLEIEKSLVYFNTALRANDLVIARLQSGRYLPMDEKNEDILEDAQIENQQAIEMAKIFSDILSGMMDAYASVISNNLNIVMKFLTAVTIVLMLPTLISGIYGMNVSIPFQNFPHIFAIIMGISFMLSGLVVYIFIKKKMF